MSKERGLNFGEEIDKMDKNNRLLSVVKAFSDEKICIALDCSVDDILEFIPESQQ